MIFPPPDFLQPTLVQPQSNPAQPHKGIMLPRLVNNNSQSGKLTWRGASAEFHRRTAHFSGLQNFLLWFSLNRNGKKSCKAIVCPKSAIIDSTMAVPLPPGVSRLPPSAFRQRFSAVLGYSASPQGCIGNSESFNYPGKSVQGEPVEPQAQEERGYTWTGPGERPGLETGAPCRIVRSG